MKLNQSNLRLAETLASKLHEAIRGHKQCALLDFPDHGNVGDSAIWCGEIVALKQLGIRVKYVSNVHSYNSTALRKTMPTGVILIHGGGNYGSIWPESQNHRERVLSDFKDYPIVQLPQSIHFDNDDAVNRHQAIVGSHPDFTLMVRDLPSENFAKSRLAAHTILCPDSAFFLHEKIARKPASVDIFVLARTDKEKAVTDLSAALATAKGSVRVSDWLDEPMTFNRRLARSLWPRSMGRLSQIPGFFDLLQLSWNGCAWERIQRGCDLLSQGRVVITDRLHAHILCTMLGIPHVVLDNSYGKVGSFIEAWTSNQPLVRRARDPLHAVAEAQILLKNLA
jgi:exopolysaccharide biosynthesis predicted pyruvyltransferase EpsI